MKLGRKCKTCGRWFLVVHPQVFVFGRYQFCSWDCIDGDTFHKLIEALGYGAEPEEEAA